MQEGEGRGWGSWIGGISRPIECGGWRWWFEGRRFGRGGWRGGSFGDLGFRGLGDIVKKTLGRKLMAEKRGLTPAEIPSSSF